MAGPQQATAVKVHCYAGYRGEETPRSFVFDEQEVQVVEIVEAWRSPQARCFKVRAVDGILYVLSHREKDDLWQLTATEQPRSTSDPTGQERISGA
ncbi:MAG: hypothetical protein ABFS09_06735 [Thermodesulfobacteriota bacterium]